jgi:hypothetical protein
LLPVHSVGTRQGEESTICCASSHTLWQGRHLHCGRLLVILLPMCTVEGNMCAHLISVTLFKLYITPFALVIGLQHGEQIQVRGCRPSNRGQARPSLKYQSSSRSHSDNLGSLAIHLDVQGFKNVKNLGGGYRSFLQSKNQQPAQQQ